MLTQNINDRGSERVLKTSGSLRKWGVLALQDTKPALAT